MDGAAVGVDAAGHHHVAVGRYGTEPGTWYATDRTGSWTLERLSPLQPTGRSASSVGADGIASESRTRVDYDADTVPLADRADVGEDRTAGAWSTHSATSDQHRRSDGVARPRADGRLYVAWSTRITGKVPGSRATNASGTVDDELRDARGRHADRHESRRRSRSTRPAGSTWRTRSARRRPPARRSGTSSNASGGWTRTLIASGAAAARSGRGSRSTTAGAAPDRLLACSTSRPGDRRGSGWRRARSGTTWSTRTISSHRYDTSPALAVDTQGHAHLLWTPQRRRMRSARSPSARRPRPAALVGHARVRRCPPGRPTTRTTPTRRSSGARTAASRACSPPPVAARHDRPVEPARRGLRVRRPSRGGGHRPVRPVPARDHATPAVTPRRSGSPSR